MLGFERATRFDVASERGLVTDEGHHDANEQHELSRGMGHDRSDRPY
jgi:hypothetical protein